MEKALIIGARGFLGSKIMQVWESLGWQVDGSSCDGSCGCTLNPTDRDAVDAFFKSSLYAAVIYSGSQFTNPDECGVVGDFRKNAKAYDLNVGGVANVLSAMYKYSPTTKMIYVSSDFVFRGDKGDYDEQDKPDPINYYGMTKVLAEEKVLSSGLDAVVARVSRLYGYNPDGRNGGGYISAVLNNLKNKGSFDAAYNHVSTPTLIDDVAIALNRLVYDDCRGIYHVAGPQAINHLDLAYLVASSFGFVDVDVRSKHSNEFNQKIPRPQDTSLNTGKMRSIGLKMNAPKEGLAIMRDQMGSSLKRK